MIKRDAVFAVSLATLLFLESWDQLEQLPGLGFYNKWFATTGDLLSALLLSVLLMAAAIFVTVRMVRRVENPLAHRVAGAALLLALYVPLRLVMVKLEPEEGHWQRLVGLVIVAAALAVATSWSRWPVKAATALAMLLSPLLPVLLFHFCFQKQPSREAWHDRPLAPMNPSPLPRRMVFVIFDSWDRFLTFEARPASLQLPDIDHFRQAAIDVERTTTPANWTRLSLPSLLTGQTVKDVEAEGPAQLVLALENGKKETFGEDMNLFRRVRELGGNTSLTGWYLPYCRVLAKDLCDCLWEPYSRPQSPLDEEPPRLLPTVLMQWNSLFLAAPLAKNLILNERAEDRDSRQWMHTIVQRLQAHALSVAGDPRFNLVVLHLPMPHVPGVFDRRTNQFSTSESANYIDNLVLVDQELRELRQAMERQGTWDSSAVLLTSDHPLRAGSSERTDEVSRITGGKMHRYVPFLLKMPGQTRGLKWEGHLVNIVSQDLILGFLRGELPEPDDVVAWLNGHGEPAREETRIPGRFYAHLGEVPKIH